MQKKLLLGSAIFLLLICGASLVWWWGYPVWLTSQYGQELQRALQRYWDVYNSPDAFADPAHLSEIMTGDILTNTVEAYSKRDSPPAYIRCNVTVTRVEEYTAICSRISANVVCGSGWAAFSGNSGQYILLHDNELWRVVNFWQDLDTHNLLWPSSPVPTCKDFVNP